MERVVDLEPGLAAELRNFEDITRAITPAADDVPRLKGVDIHGLLMPLRGTIGGDHIAYLDFNKRYDLDARIKDAEQAGRTKLVEKLNRSKRRAGILVADVSGHRVTDAVIAAMLHQSFLLGTYYELDLFGEVTTRLFEHLNTRFFKTASVNKYFTMIYGEISEAGGFRFITAGHPTPMVFSREFARFVPISREQFATFPPVGLLPSNEDAERLYPNLYGYKKRYTINEINLLGPGDILLLYTDGVSEHASGRFLPDEAERCLADARDEPAETVCSLLRERMLQLGAQDDDASLVVIKKT